MNRIKIIGLYGLTIMLCLMLTACPGEGTPEGEKEGGSNKLSLNRKELTFDLSREDKVKIEATDGLGWVANSQEDWIGVEPSNGTGTTDIIISVKSDNPNTTERKGSIFFSSTRYNLNDTISVKQEGTYLTSSTKNADFLTAGGSKDITITSNAEWEIKSKPEWLNTSVSGGTPGTTTLTITALSNPNDDERSGELALRTKNNATSTNIQVTQASVILSTNVQEVSISPEGGSADVQVTANGSWVAASNASWCRVSPTQGNGDGILGIVADSYSGTSERKATVTLRSGQTERTISVIQSVATLNVNPGQVTFSPAKGSQTVVVESNTLWTATSSDNSWCSLAPSDGSGDGNINISVAENTKAERRAALITVKAGAETRDISVAQEAISLELNSKTLAFGPQNQSATIEVKCNTSWTATSNADSWCTVAPASGTASGDIRIEVKEHTGTESRQAVISVTAGEVTRQISVKQEAPFIRLVPADGLSFSQESGKQTLAVSSNVAWTATSSDSEWCTLSKQSGQGDEKIEVMVTTNAVPDERKATITIQGSSQSASVTVIQRAADVVFTATPLSLSFSADGGQQIVTLTSNIAWTVTSQQEWLTANPQNGQGTQTISVTATKNTRNQSRSGSIVITGNKGATPITISVTQAEAVITPSEDDNPLPNYGRKK